MIKTFILRKSKIKFVYSRIRMFIALCVNFMCI